MDAKEWEHQLGLQNQELRLKTPAPVPPPVSKRDQRRVDYWSAELEAKNQALKAQRDERAASDEPLGPPTPPAPVQERERTKLYSAPKARRYTIDEIIEIRQAEQELTRRLWAERGGDQALAASEPDIPAKVSAVVDELVGRVTIGKRPSDA